MRGSPRQQSIFKEIQHASQFLMAMNVQVSQAQRKIIGYDFGKVLPALDYLHQFLVSLRDGLRGQLLKLELKFVLHELASEI